jgi:hypothetical protein
LSCNGAHIPRRRNSPRKPASKTDPKFQESPNSVFILARQATITAANVDFQAQPCDKISKIRAGESIFATSDRPFNQGKINWQKRFILVEPKQAARTGSSMN